MLITKASDVSNVGNTVTGPKIVDLPSGQDLEATVINHSPLPDLHTTSQQEEFSQANQLSSTEEDLAKVVENCRKIRSGK